MILLYFYDCKYYNLVCIIFLRSDDEQEEGPVQGPLPLEPDDAPWKRSESGIRKL